MSDENETPEETEVVEAISISRDVFLFGTIDTETAQDFMKEVLDICRDDPEKPINVWLCSEGGDADIGFSLYDFLRCISVPVVVIATGQCGSAALLVLAAGDLRLSTPYTTFFYHQAVMGNMVSSPEEMQSQHELYLRYQKQYDEILRNASGVSDAVWSEKFEHKTSKYFTAAEALTHGFIDDFLDYADKPKIELATCEEDKEEEKGNGS